MNRWHFLFLAAFGVAVLWGVEKYQSLQPWGKNAKLNLFIMAGQSNLQGLASAEKLPTNVPVPVPRAFSFDSGRWRPLGPYKNPTPRYGIRRYAFGPEITFAYSLLNFMELNEVLGVVKLGVGGTSMNAWRKDWDSSTCRETDDEHYGPLYTRLIEAVHQAEAHRTLSLWHRGECKVRAMRRSERQRNDMRVAWKPLLATYERTWESHNFQ